MDSQKLVPELRFPEFSSDWERKKLENLGIILKGLTYSPKDIQKTGLLVLRSSNIKDENLIFDDCVYVDPKVKGALLSKTGDIIICVRNGSQRLIGKNAMVTDKTPEATHGAFMLSFRANIPQFILQLFKTDKYKRQVYKDLGARINSINSNELKKYKFNVPSVDEQKKVASFMSSVDSWIDNLKLQNESLKSYKKGLMQKIFSKIDKEYSPVKLGEVATFSKGDGISKGDIEINGKNKCVRYGELYTTYGEAIDKVVSRTDQKGRKFSEKNDVLMPTSDVTPSGLATASAISESGVILGGDIMIIRSIDINNIYLSYYLRYSRKKIMKLVNGVTVYHLYSSDLAKLDVSYPPGEQQEKIAEFLTSIDKVIESKSTQITYTEAWKKGLLQQMFV